MFDLGEIQAAYYMVAATGVLVAAAYYILNMRATLETRQAQLFWGINTFSYSNDWFSSYSKLLTMNPKTADDFDEIVHDPEKLRAFHMVGGYLEGIGVLVREKLVDVRLVTLLMSGVTQWYWNNYGDWIKMVRRERNFPRYMIEAEYLAKAVREYDERHPELGVEPSPIKPLEGDGGAAS